MTPQQPPAATTDASETGRKIVLSTVLTAKPENYHS
jgi:hypothetical protein